MSLVNSQSNVRGLISAQEFVVSSYRDIKTMLYKMDSQSDFDEIIYFKDREIFATSIVGEGSKFVMTANGLYDVEKDQLRPYIKGEKFIYVKSCRMF